MGARWPRSLTRSWDSGSASRRAAWASGAIVAAVAVVIVVITPPLRDAIARTRDDVSRNSLALDVARARVLENATLARTTPPPRSRDARAAIEGAFSGRRISFVPVEANDADGRIRIVIESAQFDRLVQALDALAREDGVRVAEAMLTARIEPGTVRAELALTR